MLVSCVGVKRSTGDFTTDGKTYHYDNVNLHTEREEKNVSGICVEVFKAKLPLVEKAMGVSLAEGGSLDALVGVDLNIAFDRYSKVEMLEIVGSK